MSAADVPSQADEKTGAQSSGDHSPVFGCNGSRIDSEVERSSIGPYNFRNPGLVKQGDLRQLETLHEKFVEHLSARLSTFLRMECVAKMLKFGSTTFSGFTEGITETTHVTLFQVERLNGIGILDMSLPLSLAIADRMLGGKGKLGDSKRSLTEIEVALLEDVAEMVLVEWTHQWPEQETAFIPTIVGHDNSGKFLRTADDDVVHVIVQMEVTLGECVGQLQMGVPFAMLEPMVKILEASRVKGTEVKARSIEWRTQFNGINVPVIAEWLVKQMSVGEVIQLQPGDVLEMNRELISQTQIRLSNATEFIGTAGVEDGRVAVQLTQRKVQE